jgi:hypothetical protein
MTEEEKAEYEKQKMLKELGKMEIESQEKKQKKKEWKDAYNKRHYSNLKEMIAEMSEVEKTENEKQKMLK